VSLARQVSTRVRRHQVAEVAGSNASPAIKAPGCGLGFTEYGRPLTTWGPPGPVTRPRSPQVRERALWHEQSSGLCRAVGFVPALRGWCCAAPPGRPDLGLVFGERRSHQELDADRSKKPSMCRAKAPPLADVLVSQHPPHQLLAHLGPEQAGGHAMACGRLAKPSWRSAAALRRGFVSEGEIEARRALQRHGTG